MNEDQKKAVLQSLIAATRNNELVWQEGGEHQHIRLGETIEQVVATTTYRDRPFRVVVGASVRVVLKDKGRGTDYTPPYDEMAINLDLLTRRGGVEERMVVSGMEQAYELLKMIEGRGGGFASVFPEVFPRG